MRGPERPGSGRPARRAAAGSPPGPDRRSNLYALEFLQSLVTPSIVPGKTYFQAGQGIDDDYAMKQRSYSLFGQADYKITDKLTITGGLSYLNDRKRVVSNVVLRDPFSALNLQNVPQFTALGLPGNLYGAWAACSSTTATRRPTARSTSPTPASPAS
jgi:hypothetical protein